MVPARSLPRVLYEIVPVIADVIGAHCHDAATRTYFVRCCLAGDWDEAKSMIEGMLAEPWHLHGRQEERLREFLHLLSALQLPSARGGAENFSSGMAAPGSRIGAPITQRRFASP